VFKRITAVIEKVAALFGQRAVDYYAAEPAKVHAAISAAVLAAATALGLTVVSPAVVLAAVTVVVPVIVQALREVVYAPSTVAQVAAEALATPPDVTPEPHPGDVRSEPEAQAEVVEDPDGVRT
jgi:hypothetical protein